jgi:hypothetical protein
MKSALTQPKLKPTALLRPEKNPEKNAGPVLWNRLSGGSVQKLGYQVISVDNDPRWKPSITTDVMRWDFKKAFQPGEFEVVVAGVPCTEYSRALTTRPRDLPKADAIVQRALEIIRYLDPPMVDRKPPKWAATKKGFHGRDPLHRRGLLPILGLGLPEAHPNLGQSPRAGICAENL